MPLTPESIGLPGRVAIVTGAARGIGRATAVLLAQAGARLALCDRAGDELAGTARLLGDDDLRATFVASDVPYAPPERPPLGRFGEPADAAAAILFLAGDMARFVTGTTVHVDGGTHAAGGWHRTGWTT